MMGMMALVPRRGFYLYRNHMSAIGSYHFDVRLHEDGYYYACGACHSEDGHLYRNDQGLRLSSLTVEALNNLGLEELAVADDSSKNELLMALDATTWGLSFTYEDGHSENKAINDELCQQIYLLLLKEFAR